MGRTLVFSFFQGATYGMLGIGLVLVYRASRVLNVAQAEFGTVTAYLTFLFFEHLGWPYAISAILSVAAVVVLGLSVERVVVRPLRAASGTTRLLAVTAVALLLIAAEVVVAGPDARTLLTALPGGALVPALVGALIGGMEGLVPAFLGGVAVGLIQGIGAHLLGSHVPGAQDLTVFVLLLVVMAA